MDTVRVNILAHIPSFIHRLGRKYANPRVNQLVWQLAVPLIFLLIVMFFYPTGEKFEFSADEGINLMKAMLVDHGYPLYSNIWSDQPPLFTYLLAFDFKVFGYKVGAGRDLVLLFSTLLVWAAYRFLDIAWGRGPALAGVLFLFTMPQYVILSVSVMIGLPSIALAVLSLLFLALWHQQHRFRWVILSAVALSLSILIKLFTGFLAPIFVAGLVIAEYPGMRRSIHWRNLLLPAVIWGLVFSGLTIVTSLLFVGIHNIPELVDTHLAATHLIDYRSEVYYTINFHLKPARPFLFLTLVGIIFIFQSRRWLCLYPLAWMVSAYLLLYYHAPVWEHQQLLVTVPAALLGAVALYEGLKLAIKIIRPLDLSSLVSLARTISLIGLLYLVFEFRVPEPFNSLRLAPSLTTSEFDLGPLTSKFFDMMVRYAPETHWVVTDLPMYAFRARLLVPPNLAVISDKRIKTGYIDEAEILATIQEYNPEQVLLGRFTYTTLDSYLAQHYRTVLVKDQMKLYIRKDLRN
jgi:hypothetical protein